MRISIPHRLLSAAALVLTLCGCSHIVPVVPAPVAISTTDKIAVEVGLILSDDLKRFQVNESRLGDTWSYPNLGQASAEHFRRYLESRFEKVTVIAAADSAPWLSEGLAAVFDPRITGFTFDIPFTKFHVYPARIRYSISVYGPARQLLYRNEIDGVGDTVGSPGFDFAANPSKAASKAVDEGVRLSVEDSLAAPAVRSILSRAPGGRDAAKDTI
jgi:hypothetical protein